MAFNPERGKYYRMPIFFGPKYGPRMWPEGRTMDFDNFPKRRSFGVSFLSDVDQLNALLPECFEVWGEPIVTVEVTYLTELGWLAGRGYNMCDVKFNVVYKGEGEPIHGTLVLVRWENLTDPILSGREELGHNKLYCEIPPVRILDGHYAADMSWLAFPFLKVKIWDLKAVPNPAANPQNKGMLSYKYIPKTGEWGEAEVEYATLTPPAKQGRVLQRLEGQGSIEWVPTTWDDIPTQHHIVEAFRALEVKKVIYGYLWDGEGGASAAATHILP